MMGIVKLLFSPRWHPCGEIQDSRGGHEHKCSDDHSPGDQFHHCGVFGCGAKWLRRTS